MSSAEADIKIIEGRNIRFFVPALQYYFVTLIIIGLDFYIDLHILL